MKVKLLLCMMALWTCAFAQGPITPQRLVPGKSHQGLTQRQTTAKPFGLDEASKTNRANKARADQPSYDVDFVLDFDTETQTAYQIYLNNNDDGNVYWNSNFGVYNLVKGSNVMAVPAGNYDIIVWFCVIEPYNHQPVNNMYVIREQVDINQDMELHFATEEAKNRIHFQTLMMDGTPINYGEFNQDENGNWTQTEPCNVDDAYFINNIINRDFGLAVRMSTNSYGGYKVWKEDKGDKAAVDYFNTTTDIFVNDVSDRYAFHHYAAFIKDEVVYTSALEADGASSDIVVTTDPEKYVLFEDPFLIPNDDEELYRCFDIFSLQEGVGTHTGNMDIQSSNYWRTTPITPGQTFKYYLNASVDDSKVGFVPFIQPFVQMKVIETYDEEQWLEWHPVMANTPLTMTNGKIVLANNGPTGYWEAAAIEFGSEDGESDFYGYNVDIIDYPWFWPSHPVFTYSTDKKKENLGNNCPLLVNDIYQFKPIPNLSLWYFHLGYAGRYGERPVIADDNAQVSVKLNGEDFFTSKGGFLAQLDGSLRGVVDATITNELVQVDDLAGANKAQLHYTADAEDENPPTMTMLHFKDSNGDVTERFESGDDGTLEFSAGDFNHIITPMGFNVCKRYAPETVEVSYSPYGEDNWNELPVEEVPENYWPVMGWFYTGSLASVTGEAYKGWFDLKIRLTDAAGNWQEQVLSPAFRIDNLAYSSVANVGKDNAHEVARYSLDGKRVDASHHGVTIIKMSDGTARKVIQ